MAELINHSLEQEANLKELDPFLGKKISEIDSYFVVLPDKPWMPTHAGLEIRVSNPELSKQVTQERFNNEVEVEELKKIGGLAVIAAGVAETFSEIEDPENPDWYNKPWFNLNFNSHLGGEEFSHFTAQIYLRARTLGQMRAMKDQSEYQVRGDEWSNPYWAVPIPVDYPINPEDRRPYSQELEDKTKSEIVNRQGKIQQSLNHIKLFTDPKGNSTLQEDFPFTINQGNYPVWQKSDYLLVTQDNPLVDRRDGVHLVLIYRGEQQGLSDRYAFHWRDPRRIAEMAIISTAVSKLITENGYAGGQFDKSYIHLNANWSLDAAIPKSDQDEIMDKGSFAPGKWPGEKNEIAPPNAHPHIQVIKKDDEYGHHDLRLAFSGDIHRKNPKDRQADSEIEALKNLFDQKLTPLIENLQGQRLI